MPDGWEVANRLNPKRADAVGDPDDDELSNREEFILDTDPRLADTDDNDVPDGDEDPDEDELTNLQEFLADTDPLAPDTNDDGITDGDEDPDEDGLTNVQEFVLGHDPLNEDTDDDGTLDGDEDSDDDGINDSDEFDNDDDNEGDEGEDGDDGDDGDDGGEQGNYGEIANFDAGSGLLTVSDFAGMTVTVTVTDSTEIGWHDPAGNCADPAGIADLTTGRVIHEIVVAEDSVAAEDEAVESPTVDELSLVCD
jgi:hypothetical protein